MLPTVRRRTGPAKFTTHCVVVAPGGMWPIRKAGLARSNSRSSAGFGVALFVTVSGESKLTVIGTLKAGALPLALTIWILAGSIVEAGAALKPGSGFDAAVSITSPGLPPTVITAPV